MQNLFFITSILCISMAVSLRINRNYSRLWLMPFIAGFLILMVLNANKYAPQLLPVWLYEVFCYGLRDYVWLGVAASSVFLGCYAHLRKNRMRVLVVVFLLLAIIRYSIMPFLFPIMFYTGNSSNGGAFPNENIFENGVCMQTSAYSCGPAALVTILKYYCIDDTEGAIARKTYANPYSGTQPEHLLEYVRRRYGSRLNVEFYHYVADLQELQRKNRIFMVIWSSGLMADHYVTVLGWDESGAFIIADPANGLYKMSQAEFAKVWRHQVLAFDMRESCDDPKHKLWFMRFHIRAAIRSFVNNIPWVSTRDKQEKLKRGKFREKNLQLH